MISEAYGNPNFDLQLLTDEEQLELHIKDELEEIEEFFSKNYDETIVPLDLYESYKISNEMELRFQHNNEFDN